MRVSLIVSIGINLLLVTGIGLARVDSSREWLGPVTGTVSGTGQPGSSESGPARLPRLSGMATVADYYNALRQRGLAHDDTRLPIGGWVARALTLSGSAEHRYWAPGYGDMISGRQRMAALEESLRLELRRLYGPAVETFGEFRHLFFPLGPGFDFLTSADQVALARRQALGARAVTGGCDATDPAAGDAPLSAGESAAGRAALATLPAGYDEGMRFEYALRVSPLAARLRRHALDESTFRDAFRALQAAVGSPDARVRLQGVRELQRRLGAVQADELLQSFDPDAAMLRRVLTESEAAPAQIDAALAISARSRLAMLELLAAGLAPGEADAAIRIADIFGSERAQLETLLGTALAHRVAAARRGHSIRLTTGSGC